MIKIQGIKPATVVPRQYTDADSRSEIVYTNRRGETATRRIVPLCLYFGSTQWHPEQQWFLEAFDIAKQAIRLFAAADIHEWIGGPWSWSKENPGYDVSRATIKDAVEARSAEIIAHGDVAGANVDRQQELLGQLQEFALGRSLLKHQGLTGYWIDYIITHYNKRNERGELLPLERELLECCPVLCATQQRFAIFKEVIQNNLTDGMVLASLPCGMMSDLLTMDYSSVSDVKLVGIDVDYASLIGAAGCASERGLEEVTTFRLNDAWQLKGNEEFDILTSNGLNVYVGDDAKVVALYRKFYEALKPGGLLVTSFLTPPPAIDSASEWLMDRIDPAALQHEKVLFADVIGTQWRHYRTGKTTEKQLKAAGLTEINFIYDEAHVFPTVTARKLQ